MKAEEIKEQGNETKIDYDTVLEHVINGIKVGIPISKTLLKYNWNRSTFYNKSTIETKRYLNELKCLKSVDRTHNKYSRKDPFADFNLL